MPVQFNRIRSISAAGIAGNWAARGIISALSAGLEAFSPHDIREAMQHSKIQFEMIFIFVSF
jgi:protein-tyrosine-phosphatase